MTCFCIVRLFYTSCRIAIFNYSDLQEYNSALGKIGSNLNQIAKRMYATENVYKADVEEVKRLMRQV